MTPHTHTTVAIVGRPNVGKSTLFNKLTRRWSAIVQDTPGVTRDRNYGIAKFDPYEFIVIDTGGFDFGETSNLVQQMRQQAELAVEEADVVIFVTDASQGWMPDDEVIYRYLVQSKKPVYLAVNKVDVESHEAKSYEFFESGAEDVWCISAQHKRGIADLLDEIHQHTPLTYEKPESSEDSGVLQLAIVGKANVGKSSLVNCFLGEDRMVVDDFAGTTRDSVDTYFEYQGQAFNLIDTAGIRRKAKVKQSIETLSVVSSLKAIERADVAILMIDASEGITTQAMRVASYVEERKRGLVIAINKWDQAPKDTRKRKGLLEDIQYKLQFVDYAPMFQVSALKQQNVHDVLQAAMQVHQQFHHRVATADLNHIMETVVFRHQPPSHRGRPTKIYYGHQTQVAPPMFTFFSNHPQKINASYTQYIKNQLRYHFGFEGTPLEVEWKPRRQKS